MADVEDSLLSRIKQSKYLPTWIFSLALIVALSETIFLLILGNSLENSVWPLAIRTLEWTMVLRDNIEIVTVISSIILSLGLWLMMRRQNEKPISIWVNYLAIFISGFVIGNYIIFVIMDLRYLRGAFLLLPTIYGFLLFSSSIIVRGMPQLPKRRLSKVENAYTISHLIAVFFAAWLMMPGIPALVGMAPSPPPKPVFGYGADPGPFAEVLEIYPYELPENVTAIQGNTEEDITFSIYLSLPVLPEDPGIEGVPLGIIFHAFNNPSRDSYTDWIERLVSKGMVVAYIQYPTDVRPDGGDDFDPEDIDGMSDWPHHVPRMHSIYSALKKLKLIIDDENRSSEIDNVLGELSIMPEHLYIGGHSLGGGYSLHALEMVQEFGWGNETTMVDTEMASSRPAQHLWQPDFSNLPEHTIVHLAVGEDDMTVGQCDSVYHQQLFDGIDQNNSLLVYIPSDKYGFPRLVATHYIPANEAHDSLADWSFYRRVDAQADWVVARSRGDFNTELFAYNHLTDISLVTNMGEWSDGTPVLPLQVYNNALQESKFSYC